MYFTKMKQKQLQLLLNEFEQLSNTVLIQMDLTAKALEDVTQTALFEEAEANEIIIDRLEIKVREEVVFTIFQFAPVAADLRRIITYQDITTNLERIGDMLLNIMHFFQKTDLNNPKYNNTRTLIRELLENSNQMLVNAIRSFSQGDNNLAYAVIDADDTVDELYHQVAKTLQATYADKDLKLTKDEIRDILNINSIAHNFERIGDSATNIAESTIYLTEGIDIRHIKDK